MHATRSVPKTINRGRRHQGVSPFISYLMLQSHTALLSNVQSRPRHNHFVQMEQYPTSPTQSFQSSYQTRLGGAKMALQSALASTIGSIDPTFAALSREFPVQGQVRFSNVSCPCFRHFYWLRTTIQMLAYIWIQIF